MIDRRRLLRLLGFAPALPVLAMLPKAKEPPYVAYMGHNTYTTGTTSGYVTIEGWDQNGIRVIETVPVSDGLPPLVWRVKSINRSDPMTFTFTNTVTG